MSDDPTKIAIACQGGGSHTAFTAGALQRLLPEIGRATYDLVGFSGTSGGAICALLGWYGYVDPEHAPGALLGEFWNDLKASTVPERYVNNVTVQLTALRTMGFGVPTYSPSQTPAGTLAQRELRSLLDRYVDFERVRSLSDDLRTRRRTDDVILPALLMSAIEVMTGEFRVFRAHELTVDAVLASAAEPGIFEAVEVDGGHYWDGLFSKNPPIRDFSLSDGIPDPDEIWLIQINPSSRSDVPRSPAEIADRRNELSGNTALEQEVAFIEQVNEWIDDGHLPERYTRTEVRRIRLNEELRWSSKLDRSPEHIDALFRTGRERAGAFLAE